MNCASCRGALVEGAGFCPHCGQRVHAEAPPPDPLRTLLEQALGTHYSVVRELGRGGMGCVYLAHESGLDRDVAIKVLPPDRAQVEQQRERFRREARIAARLNHPNIVPLYSFGEHEGMLYYVMGHVEGESLAERLKREGRLAEPEARRILAAVADALHYAHERSVVHRDVKPHNILLEAGTARPMLTDFGISKAALDDAGLTGTGIVMGTPDFMSPEQASGAPDVGPPSDIYSLGVVAYVMVAGRLPFEGRTPGEVIAKRLTSEAPRLTPAGGTPSPALAEAVMRCLARNPAERWPDARAFIRALAPPDDEESSPEEGSGVLVLALGYVGLVTQLAWWTATKPHVTLEIVAKVTPSMTALMFLLVLTHASLRFRSLTLGLRHVFREPATWATWYPRPLRRTSNVWDRLPSNVRWLRLAVGAVIGGGLLFLVPVAALAGRNPDPAAWFPSWVGPVLSVATVVLLTVLAGFLFFGWRIPESLKRRGLTASEAARVAYEAPLSRSSFWSRPTIAALLSDAPLSPGSGLDAPTISRADTRTTADRDRGGGTARD